MFSLVPQSYDYYNFFAIVLLYISHYLMFYKCIATKKLGLY